MRISKKLLYLACVLTYYSCAASEIPVVSLRVAVADADGTPLSSVHIEGYYDQVIGLGETAVDQTDEDGIAHISGKSRLPIEIRANRFGYYRSETTIHTLVLTNDTAVYRNETVQLVLRDVRTPTPMYAWREKQLQIPILHKPIGFDMVKGDWVTPHGEGEVVDFSLEVTGKWQDYYNHDSKLILAFPNEGDGFVSFDAHRQSEYRSPYTAPKSGYQDRKTWRKMKRPIEGAVHEWETVDETSQDANYIFRTRTELDEDGNVKQANYGKLYGDFVFWGATMEEPYGSVIFTYYFNPKVNDCNLEFDVEENLFPNLEGEHRVRKP